MLDRVLRRAWGLSGRLTASYILVTVTVVVLVEALALGYQAPQLVNDAQLQAQVLATAQELRRSSSRALSRRRARPGSVLGEAA